VVKSLFKNTPYLLPMLDKDSLRLINNQRREYTLHPFQHRSGLEDFSILFSRFKKITDQELIQYLDLIDEMTSAAAINAQSRGASHGGSNVGALIHPAARTPGPGDTASRSGLNAIGRARSNSRGPVQSGCS